MAVSFFMLDVSITRLVGPAAQLTDVIVYYIVTRAPVHKFVHLESNCGP